MQILLPKQESTRRSPEVLASEVERGPAVFDTSVDWPIS